MDMFNYQSDNNVGGVSPTKKSIQDYICLYLGSNNVVVVDEFDTVKTRHICANSKCVSLLGNQFIPVPTTKGIINVEVFCCYRCGKIIINKSSMDFV